MQTQTPSTLLALDVGERRIGVALATSQARLAAPLTTLIRSDTTIQDVQALIARHNVQALVLGLPRGLEGQQTAQTTAVQAFGTELEKSLQLVVHWQDEAVTSRQAEEELEARGKPYQKGDIDALSATYILEDFMRDHPEAS